MRAEGPGWAEPAPGSGAVAAPQSHPPGGRGIGIGEKCRRPDSAEPRGDERHPAAMSARTAVLFATLAILASACSHETPEALVGTWVDTTKEHGHALELETAKMAFLLHGPGPGGHSDHDHFAGTWARTGSTVSLDGTWESNSKKEKTTATVDGDALVLQLGDQKVRLTRKKA